MMDARRALIVFTRLPIAGRVKTRLQSAYAPEQCAALQRAMLADIADAIRDVSADHLVIYEAERDDGRTDAEAGALRFLRATFGDDARFIAQRGADFGARLRDAHQRCHAMGYERMLFIGSDWVEIDPAELERAYGLLACADCVLKPMADGGYGLLALRGWHPEALEIRHFGAATTFAETIERLQTVGLDYRLLPPGFDIDTPADVAALYERLRWDDRGYASRCRQWLSDIMGEERL